MKVKVRHLQIPINPSDMAKEKTRKFLLDLKTKINGGASFADLAKEHSLDPGSKNNGGELGWVNRGSMVKKFETEAFTIELGQQNLDIISLRHWKSRGIRFGFVIY